MVSILELISRLSAASVEFVIIGGAAANLHGSPLLTTDLDICCRMTEQNMRKLLEARTQLSNLLNYMDGKDGAEALMTKVLNDPALLQSLANAPKPTETQ